MLFEASLLMAKGKAYIGTSGWLYPHWRGTFYPKGLLHKEEFAYYSIFFNNVEINNSFYRLPPRQVFEDWARTSNENFLFIIKANRFITHMKKLKDPKEPIQRMLDACSGLGKKLGPILFQLPPVWPLNLERFEAFLSALPKGYRYAFEFREVSWYNEEVYSLLKKHNCAFCIYQLAGHTSPIITTTDFAYIRLHGPTKNKYQGSYDFDALKYWAHLCRKWQKGGKDVYVYFDNDDSGYAAFNAQVLEMMLNKTKPITPGEAAVYAKLTAAIKEKKTLSAGVNGDKRTFLPLFIGLRKEGKGELMLRFLEEVESPLGKSKLKFNMLFEVPLNLIDSASVKLCKKAIDVNALNEDELFENIDDVRMVYRIVVGRTSMSCKGG